MKVLNIRIPANSETQIQGGAKKLVVQRANAPFDIVTHESEQYTAKAGDKITFEKHARTVRLLNRTNVDINVTLVVIRSGEGDLESSAGAVEVTNAINTVGTANRRIKVFTLEPGKRTRLLENISTRSRALIQTSGLIQLFAATNSKEYFELDGDMDEHSTAALYAASEQGTVTVRVMEYLL